MPKLLVLAAITLVPLTAVADEPNVQVNIYNNAPAPAPAPVVEPVATPEPRNIPDPDSPPVLADVEVASATTHPAASAVARPLN